MSKYVFFDIDGTLWDEKMIIPESTHKALQLLQDNDHKIFICTGRAMSNVCDPQFDTIPFDGFIASCGNHVQMNGQILYENNMSYNLVQKIYDVCHQNRLPIIFEGTNYSWLDRDGFEGDAYIEHIVETIQDAAIYLDECDLRDIQANKFSALIQKNTNYEAVCAALQDSFEFLDHGGGVIEAVPIGTSKATGIKWLCEHLNIPIEDTYAIGDSINDLEMLAFAGHSIAMGNATQPAKDVADYVTTSIHDNGIWNALKYYHLI